MKKRHKIAGIGGICAVISGLGALASSSADAGWRGLGPYGGAAQFVRVSQSRPEILVAATRRGTLFRSADGARQWDRLPRVVPGDCVLHAFEIHPDNPDTWFAGVDCEQNPSAGGLYVTTDAGTSWNRPLPLRGKGVWSIGIGPSGQRLAVGTASGVFAGYGDNWDRISPETDTELQPVVSLAYGSADESTLFAGTTHLPWRTTDSGRTWTSIHTGMHDDSDVFSIAPVPYKDGLVYASACSGVYRSENGGLNWSRLATPLGAYRAFFAAPDPHRPGVIYAGTSVGLLRSEDDGKTWKTLVEGVVHSIAFHPAVPKKIYAASESSGILASSDGGNTFEWSNRGFVNRRFSAFLVSDGALLLAGSDPESELLRSTDHGVTWHTKKVWPKGVRYLSSIPYASGAIFGASSNRVYTSRNAGESWVPLVPPGGGKIHAFTATDTGVLAATDRLHAWNPKSRAWSAVAVPSGSTVQTLFRGREGIVAASTSAGLVLSQDSGASWQICSPLPGGNETNSVAGDRRFLIAGVTNGLVRSDDGCRTWNQVGAGLSADTVSLVSVEAAPSNLAFAVQDGRVFLSSDEGQSWRSIDDTGRYGVYPSSLCFATAPSKQLFGLFAGAGVLVRSIDSGSISPDIVGGSSSSRLLNSQGDSR